MGGCHTARDTERAIGRAGFRIESIERFAFRPTLLDVPVAPKILGAPGDPDYPAAGPAGQRNGARPAAIRMAPRSCAAKRGSAYDARVWPIAVYTERPPS